MNKIRIVALTSVIVLSAFLAYGLWTLPSPRKSDAEGFSSARVVKDIEVISREHHSVAHPEERAKVREYLVSRLRQLGADTISYFRYDSLVGPRNKHVTYTFDAVNVLAEFSPARPAADSMRQTSLMFVAHYDSRYSQPVARDTVWSYGAADDGYGVGVTLEMVSQLLKDRQRWQQGVKVLFTDAEEVGMMGIGEMWKNDREAFEDVGLLLNIEARGPWGPVLLFEACPGNDKVMDLYASAARYPYTYSLTTVVYGFMPNFTDFTIVKDSIPGLNFSTVADVNHYHTDLDNFDNISEKTIQHYGEQILPIASEYVLSEKYADRDALVADSDKTNFTIPLLGLFSFSKTGYLVLNLVIFLLFFAVFAIEGIRGRIKASKTFASSASALGIAVAVLILGELFAYVCASIAGVSFKPFGVIMGISFDNVAMVGFVLAVFAVFVWMYLRRRSKVLRKASSSMRTSAASNAVASNALTALYGSMSLLFVLSAALLAAIGENMMFFIPFGFAVAAVFLWRLTSLKEWILLAVAAILLHAFSFLYVLAMAMTIGTLGAVAMIAILDFMVLVPMADIYVSRTR